MIRSVSCTTRKPRGAEVDGKDYYFVSEEEFRKRRSKGEFLEYAEVHGHWYGTLRETVEAAFRKGKSILLVIDVQGARQIRDKTRRMSATNPLRKGFVDIFVMPPSMNVLRKRLMHRGEDAPAVIRTRLRNAEKEMKSVKEFKYAIVNDQLDLAVDELEAILKNEA
jgi:guanylate kinase